MINIAQKPIKMKASKLLFFLLFIPLFTIGQDVDDFVEYEKRNFDKFMKSTTYIVLDQFTESEYSLKLIEAVKEHWTITPYEIIDKATYKTYVKDRNKSFLTREYIAGDEKLVSLSLFMGGQRYMDERGVLIANVKLKHYTATDDDFLYKLPIFIQNIQWKVQLAVNLGFESKDAYQDYLDKNKHLLHSRKLYILNEHLTSKIESLEKLKKYYRHDVRLVNRSVIEDAILTQDTTVAFLSIVAPVKNWGGQTAFYRVFTADKGESLVSYDRSVSSSAPVGVIGYDLKTFNK